MLKKLLSFLTPKAKKSSSTSADAPPGPRQIAWFVAMEGGNGKAADKVMQVMVDRNNKGKELEKKGQIAKAIALYEANMGDYFIGTYPYDRLRILYTKDDRLADAIRVCDHFLQVAKAVSKWKQIDPKTIQHFSDHMEKLKKKR